jgi:membrane fusion protein, multidrug efflux system
MKQWISIIVLTVVLVGFADSQGEFFAAEEQATREDASKPAMQKTLASEPIACVKTILLSKGTIMQEIVVYGSTIAAPGALQTVSMPFESRILGVMVNDGQKVAKGDILLKIQPSPDTMLQLDQVKNAYNIERQSFQQMERRYNLKLATNEQLLQARQALEQAKLRLESLTRRGVDGDRKIPSSVFGLVKKVYVQEGSIVPAGSAMVDIVAQNQLEILVGVEPEDIARVHPSQAVSLKRVNAPASSGVTGQVRKISYAVNPSTRLVDVFLSLMSPAGFLLGESIIGKIVTSAEEGIIVPRSAVLPEGDHHVLFSVKDGRAVKHMVEISSENNKQYQIVGKKIQEGQDVVVLGNYELTDGMKVTTETCR